MDPGSLSLSELIALCSDTRHRDLLDAFVQQLQAPVAGVVSRTLRRQGVHDPETVKDLCQQVFLKLLGSKFNLKDRSRGRTDGEILGLIRATAANLVVDAIRASRPTAPIDQIADISWTDRIEERVLVQEVDTALKKLLGTATAARDYRIFWFYHRDRMTAREISLLPGICLSVKGVESVIFRLTTEVKAVLTEPKGIPAKGAF